MPQNASAMRSRNPSPPTDGKAVADVPDWAGQLGQVTPGPCVALADSYRQTQTLLCEFSYASAASVSSRSVPGS